MSGSAARPSAIFSLALSLKRDPARHPGLIWGNGDLPEGVNSLLRFAGGTALRDIDPELVELAPEPELRMAALFFIEEVLFASDADHYRILGLNRDAAADRVKEHHRYLMRIFHPDRDNGFEAKREEFAARANLAYNTLRDTESRKAYDERLSSKTTTPELKPRRHPPMPARRLRPEPESFWTVKVKPVLMRYPAQWALGTTALIAFMMVGMTYWANPLGHSPVVHHTEQPEPVENHLTQAGKSAVTETYDEAVIRFERKLLEAKAPFNPALSAETTVPAEIPKATNGASTAQLHKLAYGNKTSVPAVAWNAPVQALAVQKQVIVQRNREVEQANNIAASQVVAMPVLAESKPEIRPATEPAAIKPVAADLPKPGSARVDPGALLAKFLEAYERGDTQACNALLDQGLRADAGGKQDLLRVYENKFLSTDLRNVRILNISWYTDGQFIRGRGRYRATVMLKGESVLRTRDGNIRVEIVQRGESALINELYYMAGL